MISGLDDVIKFSIWATLFLQLLKFIFNTIREVCLFIPLFIFVATGFGEDVATGFPVLLFYQ